MKDMKKILDNIIEALDGHTAATSEEAEQILQSGYLPIDEFMKKVKAAAEKANKQENVGPDTPVEINIDDHNI